jgi:flagellin
MALTVNTNVSSLNAQRNLSKSGQGLATSMERLASGMRINSAKDDAAGLQISNRLTSQINGLSVAQRNANDAISIAQTAEGAMQESTNILQRMRELALQSANGSNSTEDRDSLQKEVNQLVSELDRIADKTVFGGQKLLDGSFGTGGTASFQVGANAQETIEMTINSVSSSSLGNSNAFAVTMTGFVAANIGDQNETVTITNTNTGDAVEVALTTGMGGQDAVDAINEKGASVGLQASFDSSTGAITFAAGAGTDTFTFATDATANGAFGTAASPATAAVALTATPGTGISNLRIDSENDAQNAITSIDAALKDIDDQRATLGALQNRFGFTISNLANIQENVSSSRSRIQDADFAVETANMTKNQILQQAGTSILSQANQIPQAAISLLGG